jgi:hypothetical protein
MIAAIVMGIIAYLAYPPEMWSIHFTKFSMGLWLRILATFVFGLLAVSVFVTRLTKRW